MEEVACKCIWVKDQLNFLEPLEIQMLIFPFPKPKVPVNNICLMPTIKPAGRDLDPCLADGRKPWNLGTRSLKVQVAGFSAR